VKRKNTRDDQGHFLLNKIDISRFETLDETFNELKIPAERIHGKLPTIEVICRTSIKSSCFNLQD
jgi:hypothetical protein